MSDYLKPIRAALHAFFFGTKKRTDTAPYIIDNIDIKRFMTVVIIGLLPATFAGIYFYGLRVILMILVSYLVGGIVEVIFAITRKKEIHEGFLVTGLIFPLTLPPTTPLWVVGVGILFGVLFGKEVFGGTGRNIFNPALVGRIFLTIAFPEIMANRWVKPMSQGFLAYQSDAVTQATPLSSFKSDLIQTPWLDLFLGMTPGCVGETFRLGILIGGLFLIITKISNWRIPFSYLLTVFIFSAILHQFSPTRFAPPLFQLLSGGLFLGAFFMATDPVSSPWTKTGKWVGGIFAGLLTVIIRALSGFVEGVMFSIILLNTFTPLIDSIVLSIKYRKGATGKWGVRSKIPN